MYIDLHVRCLSFSSDFNDFILIFSTYFRKILEYLMSWKSCQWEPSCSVRRDGQTDIPDEGSRCFSQFCERAKSNNNNNKYIVKIRICFVCCFSFSVAYKRLVLFWSAVVCIVLDSGRWSPKLAGGMKNFYFYIYIYIVRANDFF